MERVTVRPVDREEAFEAHALAFPDDEWCGDCDLFWLARRGKELVGFLSLFVDERGVYISRVAVVQTEAGLGKRLVRFALRYGKRQGARYAYTYTLMKNYRSMCMLLRCGFRFVEPEKPGQYRGNDVHYFARAI